MVDFGPLFLCWNYSIVMLLEKPMNQIIFQVTYVGFFVFSIAGNCKKRRISK